MNAPAAAADAFFSTHEQLEVFEQAPGERRKNSRVVQALAQRHEVSPWIILEMMRVEKRNVVTEVPDDSGKVDGVGEVPLSAFEEYPRPSLVETHRPPSRGGNTRALHRHALRIDGVWYSWRALGGRKWAHKGDQVAFRFKTTSGGHRHVIKRTFRAVDSSGKEVARGNRDFKPQLRRS